MKKITDIKPQLKTPTRCNIYLDNAFYCGMELETIMRHRLKIGTEIDPEKLAEIQAESESMRALDKALNFISRSQKTKKQVKEYLEKKGYLSSVIDVVLDKMSAYKFVNDQNYAKDYAKGASKDKGKRLIALELSKKGVSHSAEKYLRNKEKTKENALKCYKYLLSKGFSYDTAKSATDKIISYEDEDF